jgi:hypothetical protein
MKGVKAAGDSFSPWGHDMSLSSTAVFFISVFLSG